MALLATLDELKHALDIAESDTTKDEKLTEALEDASDAVRTYCQREFKTPADSTNSTRRYIYEGDGILEIDDAKSVAAVTIVRSGVPDTVLTVDEYEPQPYDSDAPLPYYWIDILPRTGESPEMGFARNLDTLWYKYLLPNREVFVDVSAKWGWDSIPKDIRRATIWTAAAFLENPRAVVSERVAGVARTYANPARGISIPERAKDLLYNFQRIK